MNTIMSDPTISFSEDHQLISQLVDGISNGVLHLLRPEQIDPRPTAADLSLGLQILKTTADTTWRLAVRAGMVAEKDRLEAETKKIQAETEKLVAEKERMWAEKGKIEVANERSEAGKGDIERVEMARNRMVAETARITAGKDQEHAETEQIKAETARITAEKDKKNAQTEQIKAKTATIRAEVDRINAETQRVKAEEVKQANIRNMHAPRETFSTRRRWDSEEE